LPVIVYIHGGGFFAGTAGPSFCGPDYFMDAEDVIFVAMNYRLGPLGFLSTGDSNMSGNFGLKDQAMAIKWVKQNIQAFGGEFENFIYNFVLIFRCSKGDSENISLMGQSAGAASAHLHMMSSPKWSRNLFQKVVLMSGNANAPYAYVIKDPFNQAKDFAKAMGIENLNDLDSSKLAEKLRNSNPEDLINACDKLKVWNVDSLTISRPVVEDCESNDGFLCENPIDSWRSGNFAHVPILTGFMDGDGGVRALSILEDKNQLNDLNKRFDYLLPKIMEIDDTKKHLTMIKERYFNGLSEIKKDTFNDLIRLYDERSFITPLYNTLQQLVVNDRKTPAYLYKFSFKGPLSYASFYTGSTNYNGFSPVHW
jgi:juvenile-hormone esterase